ncbi:hypothetical protein BKA82DRAFT_10478 [Pisolithus tinctorius]|uniref:Uncharacterized protein n=1 Tax=Pisolithus tinctorius Marx 270 TaxID=870435 RepID=A0A0C3JN46_PISTI|nr:hypothetical protein BKA82DRAFT_10478 [Pisolithus tinctorius]KIN98946.1 hypothetical protein M404DRAFT_10478 [Pisolithus tinctorius Marx 270]
MSRSLYRGRRCRSPNHGSCSPDFNDAAPEILASNSEKRGGVTLDSDSEEPYISGTGQGAPVVGGGHYIRSLRGESWHLDAALFAKQPRTAELHEKKMADHYQTVEANAAAGENELAASSTGGGIKRRSLDSPDAPETPECSGGRDTSTRRPEQGIFLPTTSPKKRQKLAASSTDTCTKRRPSDSLDAPETPKRLGGSTTTTQRPVVFSLPTSPPQKRQKLASPFEFNSSTQEPTVANIADAIRDAGDEIKEALDWQNALLKDILKALVYGRNFTAKLLFSFSSLLCPPEL